MKKMFLMVVAMMSMTVAFAETSNTEVRVRAERNYDMSFDLRRLAVTLGLNTDQMEAVQNISDNFNREMSEAATAKGFRREVMIDKAVGKNVKNMRYVLDREQFHTYVTLLRNTLRNQHIR